MDIQNLIECLNQHRNAIGDEMVQKIDFDQLEKDLNEAACALSSLSEKEKLSEKLLSEFKSEIKRMSQAISRAKGDLNTSGMVERFLSSENLSFDELILLREKVREDFNKSFPTKPQTKVVDNLGFGEFKISEFKAGGKE